MKKKYIGLFMAAVLCSSSFSVYAGEEVQKKIESDHEYIETTLNLANNEEQIWTYTEDAWTLSPVLAVVYPELPEQQGVSVCVPADYVTGIDTDNDGTADITEETYETETQGSLIIDYEAEVTSTNGQKYTAATAPVILNTGAAGYGSCNNSSASTAYAAEGYINVSCGNRGKQDYVTDEDEKTVYTGDAPSCLADQKAAARFVKYNILLGNLPGNVDYFVSTGGSGGGAHAAMFAATSNNPDFYDYQIEAGAVGVYQNEDGSYSTSVTIDGTDYEISDGAWGCIAYSAITSLAEADMAQAFEYYLDTTYEFGTPFQAQMAEYLSAEYMDYINGQELSVKESAVGFDLNKDGDMDDETALTIEYDSELYPETNGYYGTYLDLYLAEFTENLQWYLDNLDYAEGWTWFGEDGSVLSDEQVADLTSEEKAAAFVEGRYTKGSSGGMGVPGTMTGDPGALPDGMELSDLPDGIKGDMGKLPDGVDFDATEKGAGRGNKGGMPGKMMGDRGDLPDEMNMGDLPDAVQTGEMEVGTPDAGTTQSATGAADSNNYGDFDELTAAYKTDIESIYAGDEYGKNIVDLYNPLNYIDAEGTENPAWIRIMMGAAEGDMSMFSSLNLHIAFLNADVDSVIEWQWDGGHVPSEILGNSLPLYVDQMYGKYVENAEEIQKPAAEPQTENGTAEEASGTDLSSWVNTDDISAVSFSLADAAAYRTKGASKAVPGFDVIDYGQEDYVFGNAEQDARHWNQTLLKIFEEHGDVLSEIFNQ